MSSQTILSTDAARTLGVPVETTAIGESEEPRAVIAMFRDRPALEALPVVDAENRPVGAVLERDIRSILLNPFGHALLQNATLYHRLADFVRPVPVAEIGAGPARFFEAISQGGGHDALIVTENGRFAGVLGGRQLLRLAASREAGIAARREERLRQIAAISEAMRHETARMAREIGVASAQLEGAAQHMAEQAGAAGAKGLSVMAAAAQAADNVGAIAAEGHRLAGELDELGREVGEARASTERVGTLIEAGGTRARHLDQAAHEIGDVIETIDRIARRINLLALNATIEAARAGDAGRGFAVVASEVKTLAQQTREAAGQIGDRLTSFRSGVSSVVTGQGAIQSAIRTLEALASTIDEAVARNGAASQSISVAVRDAADANDHIRNEAADINATAEDTVIGSEAMTGIARSLSQGADRLQFRFNRFLEEIADA